MSESFEKIRELDGKQLYYSFLSGAQRIFENQKLLNRINVFPVNDSDTGTNLASTMRSIMDAIIPTDNLKETAVAMADAALTGARGNSGIIFAQFLYGFGNELDAKQTMDIKSFAESMRNAVNYAYEAIANPVEGTILTVIKDWAEYLYSLKDIIDDFIKLLLEAYERAQQSLEETTAKLTVLARSHVVDAGAKGFVVFLEGILDFFTKGGEKHFAIPEQLTETEGDDIVTHEEITFRYCTEALISADKLDKTKIRNTIKVCGDSLVVAGSPQKMRIHIHTDFPAELFSYLRRFGNITYQKVDDMVMQHEILTNRKSGIAILTDSSCDLPKDILDRLQVHMVPLSLHFGETMYLDRYTIQPEQFYSLLAKSEQNPTSAQPSIRDFQNKYEYLCTHYSSVIAINLSKGLSGTFNSSSQAAKEVSERTGKKIDVIDSGTLTGGLGLLILRLAEELEKGTTHEEVMAQVRKWVSKSQIRVTLTTLKYIIRSGRVSAFKSFVARLLDLKPVITLDEDGRAVLSSKSFTEKASMKKVIRDIKKIAGRNKIWGYAITHASNPQTACWYATQMEKITGQKPVFIAPASPALGANTGPGVTCVSFMLE
ncbi:MAG: DegV family EDD domain-containing protein [Bacteroidetes bacterium]|nr:DegV family EDD domain-containing protein [Bacteroidota bacterium]